MKLYILSIYNTNFRGLWLSHTKSAHLDKNNPQQISLKTAETLRLKKNVVFYPGMHYAATFLSFFKETLKKIILDANSVVRQYTEKSCAPFT